MNKAKHETLLQQVLQNVRERGIVVINVFPAFQEEVFRNMSDGVPARAITTARLIIDDHLVQQEMGKPPTWFGAPMPDDRSRWNANNLVTAYYLCCQPHQA